MDKYLCQCLVRVTGMVRFTVLSQQGWLSSSDSSSPGCAGGGPAERGEMPPGTATASTETRTGEAVVNDAAYERPTTWIDGLRSQSERTASIGSAQGGLANSEKRRRGQ
jgi:hypothetical protein